MKKHLTSPLVIRIKLFLILSLSFTILTLNSCKKETVEQEKKPEYIQYIFLNIVGKDVYFENSINTDRFKLKGSWTGLNYPDKSIEYYTVRFALPRQDEKYESTLHFKVYDIKQNKIENLNGSESDPSNLGFGPSYISFIKTMSDKKDDYIKYSPNLTKKPFNIEITRYDFLKDGHFPPIVGGKLNGVLYNEKNLLDSVVIKDGRFEVRH